MLEDTSILVLGERLEGNVRGHQNHSVRARARARAVLEDTSTLVLGERQEGCVRGHQHPSVRREARGLC